MNFNLEIKILICVEESYFLMIKLYSYIITSDSGFAPNPFYNLLTLACCKPVIRRILGREFLKDLKKENEYWIVGLSSKPNYYIIFAMKITDVKTFREYYLDNKFSKKKPNFDLKKLIYQRGDNIYEPTKKGFIQHRSLHSHFFNDNLKWRINDFKLAHDLSGEYVLISNDFYYFGGGKEKLPIYFKDLKVGRNHKRNFSEETKEKFVKYIRTKHKFINNPPSDWGDNDNSWKHKC